MSTLLKVGNELKEIDLLKLFKPVDGEITQRYGRIGQGKTYGATVDVLDELRRGHVVYCNWHINWNGYDQRESFLYVIGSIMFPWINKLSYFPKENLKYISIDENFIAKFSQLTNCSVYLDEGHVVFDSYEMAKMSMQKRVAVLHTRHFDRSINIISQRPTAIHSVLRENVNRFYKYQRYGNKYPFILFKRTEYQDLTSESKPDEDQPLSVKLYFLKKSIANNYDSKYLRGDIEISKPHVHTYKLNILHKIRLLFSIIFKVLTKKRYIKFNN